MVLTTVGLPPEQAKTGPLNSPTRSTSWVRAERIGPTFGASLLWKTVANRVGPAPQASNTMSAESRPDCGRAPGSLETLTTTAGRRRDRRIRRWAVPVSGITGSGAIVVRGGRRDDVVVDEVVDDDVVVALRRRGRRQHLDSAGVAAPQPAPLLQATSPRAMIRIDDALANLTVLSTGRCALRAGGGCRTCGSRHRTCLRRPRPTSVARSTCVRSQL